MAAKRHDFEKHAKRDHQPLKRELGQLMMSNTRSSRVVVSFSMGLQVEKATRAIVIRTWRHDRIHTHSGPERMAT